MKKPILKIRDDEGTVENIMGIVSRLRDYQDKNTKTPQEVINFYESIREQLYFNKALEKPAIYLLYDFVNSEITRAMYKQLDIKPTIKSVLRVNPLINVNELCHILFSNLSKEGWIKCDEASFKRIFVNSDKELYPIQFFGGQPELIRLFCGLTEIKSIKEINQRVLIEKNYSSVIVSYFIDKTGKKYKKETLAVSKLKNCDKHTIDIIDAILKQVYQLY